MLLPKVKLKTMTTFPSGVYDGAGIDVRKENGNYYFDLDFADYPVISTPDPYTSVLTYNVASQSYFLAPYNSGSGGSSTANMLSVNTIAELKALDTTVQTTALLKQAGRAGEFVWRPGDYTAQITADPQNGVYAKANALPMTAGAWVRVYEGPVDLAWFGAAYGGTVDTRSQLAAADTLATQLGCAVQVSGICKVSSAVTIANTLSFTTGGRLVPDSAILVKLATAPEAGLYQIFDRSAGGAIEFTNSRIPAVYVEWWGARGGDGGRTDNNIPIQHAIDALQSVISGDFGPAPDANNMGGECRFGCTAEYLVSSYIHTRSGVTLKGNGSFTTIKANPATWTSGTEMWISQNGVISQFWCKADGVSFDASSIPAIQRVIYAPAWQESCGLRDVRIQQFMKFGLQIDNAYGGAVGCKLSGVQFFPDNGGASGMECIHIDVPGVVSRYHLLLEEVSFASAQNGTGAIPTVEINGVSAIGNVDIDCRGVFGEGMTQIIALAFNASLFGNVRAGGNPTVREVIAMGGTWTGVIDAIVNKGSAAHLLRNYSGTGNAIYLEVDPPGRRIVYPHTPSQVLAAGTVTNGTGTPAITTTFGFSSVAKAGAGLYRLTFNTAKFKPSAGAEYQSRVVTQAVAGYTWYVSAETSTYVEFQFVNLSGVATDIGQFYVEIYARPGP